MYVKYMVMIFNLQTQQELQVFHCLVDPNVKPPHCLTPTFELFGIDPCQ